MLFRKKTVNEKIEHLVKKNDFYELADYVHGTKEEKIDLATALGANDNNSSVDLLLRLIDDNDEDVIFVPPIPDVAATSSRNKNKKCTKKRK